MNQRFLNPALTLVSVVPLLAGATPIFGAEDAGGLGGQGRFVHLGSGIFIERQGDRAQGPARPHRGEAEQGCRIEPGGQKHAHRHVGDEMMGDAVGKGCA